jgi:signal peptidase I
MAKFLRFLAWTSLVFAVLVGILRLTAIRWWQVPLADPYLEASVAPTLRGGDWIILWRATAPSFGSLVLCPEPKANGRQVIARIVGEARDHVQVGAAGLQVNRARFESEGACDPFSVRDPGSGAPVEQICRGEIIASRSHWRGEQRQDLPQPAEAELDVPSAHVFLVSDNRQFPWDSREFGPVPRDACRETVIFRLLSKDGFFDVANRFTLIR